MRCEAARETLGQCLSLTLDAAFPCLQDCAERPAVDKNPAASRLGAKSALADCWSSPLDVDSGGDRARDGATDGLPVVWDGRNRQPDRVSCLAFPSNAAK